MIGFAKVPLLAISLGIFASGATHAETIKMVFGTYGSSEYGDYQAGNIYVGDHAAPPAGTCGARVENPDAWYFAEMSYGGFGGPLDLYGNGDPADYIQVTGPFGAGCDGSYHFQTPAFQGFHGPEGAGAIIIQGDDITWLDHADNPVPPKDPEEVDWCPPNTCKLLLDLLACYWELDHNGNPYYNCGDDNNGAVLVGFATQIKVLSRTMSNNAILLQQRSKDRQTAIPTAYRTATAQMAQTVVDAVASAEDVYAGLRRQIPAREASATSTIRSLDVHMDLLRLTAEQCAGEADAAAERHFPDGTELTYVEGSCAAAAENAQSVIDGLVLLSSPRRAR